MKRFLFAVAVVALAACVSLADDKPATGGTTPTPTPTPGATTVTPGTVMVESAQPARRGLFSRLRNRNTTNYSTPTTVIPSATPMPTPAPTPAPTPMPGVKPAGGTITNPGTIIQASSSSLPPGIYTTTDGTVVQVGGGTMPMQPMMQSSMQSSTRTGLFSRLRSR